MSTALDQFRGDAETGNSCSTELKATPAHEAFAAHKIPAVDPTPARAVAARHVTRVVATSPWYETGLAELMQAYELLFVFTWRQIGVQYKQAILGIGWAIITPLISTVVFTLIFGKLAAIPSEGLPYSLFVLSGLTIWQYFARAVTMG